MDDNSTQNQQIVSQPPQMQQGGASVPASNYPNQNPPAGWQQSQTADVAQSYPQQQPYVQQPQNPISAPTPEAPSLAPERAVEPVLPVETTGEQQASVEKTEQKQQAAPEKREQVQVPDQAPDEKKFESPYKLYGYQASDASIQNSSKNSSRKGRGNIALSQTWLFVLLGRVLKMQDN